MKRREFITLLGGAAATWPLAARAHNPIASAASACFRRASDDQDYNVRIAAFQQRLQQLGWTDGHNVRIDYRLSQAIPRTPQDAAELIALAPDVILAPGPSPGANAPGHPHGAGRVCVRRRSGRRRPYRQSVAAGRQCHRLFAVRIRFERKMAGAAQRDRAERDASGSPSGPHRNQRDRPIAVIQSVARSLGVEVNPLNLRDAGEIERAVTAFARSNNGGLIVPASAWRASSQSDHCACGRPQTARSLLRTLLRRRRR